ncbi:MAG: competence/damage-inducible protein A [Fimbriimonadaceae bacterium]|nr:competence/damage-inducible protein A [Fimbriimonadaceae bacterium]QYK58623.1 MAG: competence/damage-inducible protein A [Fimbriimonadaceae bacterium]
MTPVAETVSIGTELLLGQIVDTNASEAGRVLAECGIAHTHRQTVGDNFPRLVQALKLALSRAEIVLTVGGLGPTEDDLTREGIAEALGDSLVHDPAIEAHLRSVFEARRLPWLDSQLRQAQRPSCARPLINRNGTAPGLVCQKDGKTVIALPGPRGEFVPLLEGPVREVFLQLGGGQVIRSRVLRVIGIGESVVEDRLKDLMAGSDPTLAPYAKTGEVHLRLTKLANDRGSADQALDPLEAEIRRRLGDAVYGVDDETLESAVVSLLKRREATVSTAESCTGGWIGARLTSVPGSSDCFVGGVVTYSNRLKQQLVGVKPETLEAHGAVSAEVAEEMALGARERLGSDFSVSVTGVAGPGGGSEDKPVGLVYIGVASPKSIEAHRHLFTGLRETVRLRSTQMALFHLRNRVLDL